MNVHLFIFLFHYTVGVPSLPDITFLLDFTVGATITKRVKCICPGLSLELQVDLKYNSHIRKMYGMGVSEPHSLYMFVQSCKCKGTTHYRF